MISGQILFSYEAFNHWNKKRLTGLITMIHKETFLDWKITSITVHEKALQKI